MASRRSVDLVGQILEFSRQTEREVRPPNMGPIVKEVIKLLREQYPGRSRYAGTSSRAPT